MSRRFRSAFAVLLGASLITGITQTVPAYADTVLPSPLQVNFQASTSTAPSGYIGDYGRGYDATRGYGWYLQGGTNAVDLTSAGRQRNVNANPLLDTFVQMQNTASGSGVKTSGAWKANVANGTYAVTVSVGDPSYTDSHDIINVEGTNLIDFTPTTGNFYASATQNVTVIDGVLNMDAIGGTNTKVDYITAVPAGTTPTPTPTVTVTPSGTSNGSGAFVDSATVTVAASETGGTIAGTTYTVDAGAVTNYTAPFAVTGVGSHTVSATTTDANGATATASSTFGIVASGGNTGTGTTTAHFQFGPQTLTPVNGYTLDYGQPFGTAGTTYGWEANANGAPTSFVGNGRTRNVNPKPLQDSLQQPQLASQTSGVHTAGRWETAVANGQYTVTLGIGDPAYTDSHDIWNIEGAAFADFTPSTAQPQTVVTKDVTVTDGRLTLDPTGGTNSKVNYIDIVPAGGTTTPPGDTTAPTVNVAVNGSTNSSGAYLDTATVAVTATDPGSGVKSISYSLDSGAQTPYTAPVQVSSLGAHTFSATATDNSNNTSAAVTKTFNVVASSGSGPKPTSLTVVTPQDNLGVGSRVVFSTVYNQQRPGKNLTLGNKGGSTLNVTGLTVTAPFQLCAGQATSFNINPGATATACVQYRPTVSAASNGTQVDQGTLTIKTNDTTVPNYPVTLGGLDAENYESFHEPDLQQMFNALGYTDNVGVTDKPQGNSISSANSAQGDEVLSPYFLRLNSAAPVQLVPLAHYSGKSSSDSNGFGWYNYGSNTNNLLYCFPGGADGSNDGYGQNQLLLPNIKQCGGTTGTTAFNPSGSFGIVDPYPGYTVYSDDAKNSGGWHDMRAYPAKDANGNVIAGEYLIGDDIGAPNNNSAKNWDYQDFAYLLINAKPDTSKVQPKGGVQNQTVSSFGGSGGVLGTGFTGYQGASDTSKISVSGGQLKVTTSAGNSNTNHINALDVPVQSGDKFQVTSRLVGPFTAIDAGEEQQGIFWGPDASHYVKAEIDYQGSRHLTFYIQNGSSGSFQTVVLPANATTVDLRLTIDPSPQGANYGGAPRASMSYAINGGGFTNLGNVINFPTTWFTDTTPAGIMVSHQNGGSAFTATYANFSVVRGY